MVNIHTLVETNFSLFSRSFLLQEGERIFLNLANDALLIRFEFIDSKEGEAGISVKATGSQVVVQARNFGGPLGSVLLSPLDIGNIGSRKMMLTMSCIKIGDEKKFARQVHIQIDVEGQAGV